MLSAALTICCAGGNTPTQQNRPLVFLNGQKVRVDLEYPQGTKPANVHVQIKGLDSKYIINTMDDIDNLPKSIRKNTIISNAISKALKTIAKLT